MRAILLSTLCVSATGFTSPHLPTRMDKARCSTPEATLGRRAFAGVHPSRDVRANVQGDRQTRVVCLCRCAYSCGLLGGGLRRGILLRSDPQS